LSKVPADRHPTAAAFGDALGALAQPRGGTSRRRASATAAVIAVAALAGFGISQLTSAGSEAGQAGPQTAESLPSIAILPLENRSGRQEDAFFTDGIHDEVLTRLSKISGLSVRGRTSVMQYRSTTKPLTQIGEELNARFLLEGGVLRAGEQLRINVQLVDAQADEQLWGESFTRELSAANLLELQSEIAQRIASALQVELSPDERARVRAHHTDNLEAYEHYLKGKEYWARSQLERDRRLALHMFRSAVELDPDFSMAYAKLSRVHSSMWFFHHERNRAQLDSARMAVDRALNLDPDLPEAHLALGYYHYWGHMDYQSAVEEFERVLEAQPGNLEAILAIGAVRRRQGRMDEAIAAHERAAELDPRDARFLYNAGISYLMARRYGEAEASFDRAIFLTPDWATPYDHKAALIVWRGGGVEDARAILTTAEGAGVEIAQLARTRVWLDRLNRDFTSALNRLDSITSDAEDSQILYLPNQLVSAQIHALAGNRKVAEAHFDSASAFLLERIERSPDDSRLHSSLGIAYAGLGRKDAAIAAGERAVQLLPVSQEALRGTYRLTDLAQIYAWVGEENAAIDQLECLLAAPGFVTVHLLRLDPIWDPIRDHPGFQRLLENYADGIES
jgi:serine/threonine-protein kinase